MNFNINLNTLPKFNSTSLKNDGWKTILSYWVTVFFQGLLNFGRVSIWTSWWFQPIWKILVKMGSSSPNTNQSCAWKFVPHISQPSILEYHHFRKPLYLSNHIFYFPLPRLANPIRHRKRSPRPEVWFWAKTGGGAVWGLMVDFYRGKRYLKHRFNQFAHTHRSRTSIFTFFMNGWFLCR